MKLLLFALLFAAVPFAVSAPFVHAEEDVERGLLAERLMSDKFATDTGLDVRGWIAQGFTYNPDAPRRSYNGPVTFNDRANEYQMNQLYLVTERKIVKSGDDWSLGGRVNLLYGTDAAYTQALGFDEDIVQDRTSRNYKFAIPQVYAEANVPVGTGLTFKAGHFYTPIGYEVVTAPDNIFYSHAYTMQYGEPFTHWGAVLSYAITDKFTLTAGGIQGWDNLSDSADGNLSFLGSAAWTISDSSTLVVSFISGNEGIGLNRTGYSAVLTEQLGGGFAWVMQHDFFRQEQETSSAVWYGLNNYLLYSLNDQWSFATRLEWFRDEDGTRVAGLRSGSALAKANYFAWTLGAQYRPCGPVIIRPEIRYDWQNLDGPGQVAAFDEGRESGQLTVAADAIVKF